MSLAFLDRSYLLLNSRPKFGRTHLQNGKRTWGMTKKSLSCRFQPLWKIWIIMGPYSPNRGRNSSNKLYPLAFEIQTCRTSVFFCFLTVPGNDTAHAMAFTISPCYNDMWLTRLWIWKFQSRIHEIYQHDQNMFDKCENKSGYCCCSFLVYNFTVISHTQHPQHPQPPLFLPRLW